MGVHEISHILVAKSAGVKLGVPYFVPSWQVRLNLFAIYLAVCISCLINDMIWWQIGSFGAITRFLNIVPNRESLLKIAAAGPLAGYSLGLFLLLLGFYLPPSDGIGIIVELLCFTNHFLLVG